MQKADFFFYDAKAEELQSLSHASNQMIGSGPSLMLLV